MEKKNSLTELVLVVIIGSAIAGNCDSNIKIKKLENKIDNLEPKIETKQVIGNSIPEKFYEIGGKKIYLEIDGKPVEQYFVNRNAESSYEELKPEIK